MQFDIVVGSELEIGHEPLAYASNQVIAQVHFVRDEIVAFLFPRIAALHVVRVELAVGVAGRQHHAEAIVEHVAPAHAATPGILPAQVVVAVIRGRREEAAVRIIEHAGCDQIDRAADGVAIQIGSRSLHHFQLGQDVGRHGIERDATRIAFRRSDQLTVDRHIAERGIDAADGDVTTFALVRGDCHANDTGQGFTRVLVWKLACVVGSDRFLDGPRRFLVLKCRDLRQAIARHRDFLQLCADAAATQCERLLHFAAFGHVDTVLLFAEAHVLDLDAMGAGGQVRQAICARSIGYGGTSELWNSHGCVGQRSSRAGVRHAADQITGPGRSQRS